MSSRPFWIISRTAQFLYGLFPIFGALRGAVAIIRRDGGYVVVERNDGLAFPGGMARFHEDPEKTVRREVLEETGLTITTADFKFDFRNQKPLRTHTFVFEATVEGELRSSWEGTVRIVGLSELQERVTRPQRRVVEHLLTSASTKPT